MSMTTAKAPQCRTPGASPCPVGSCPSSGHCEVLSLCASQVSTVAVLLGTSAGFAARAYLTSTTEFEKFFAVQGGLVLVITTLCYLMGAWRIEQRYIKQMREVQGRWATIEWILRIVILIVLGIASVILGGVLPILLHLPPVGSALLFLCLCSVLFLFWDAAVTAGGKIDEAWSFYLLDLFGAVSATVCLIGFLSRSVAFGSFALVVPILYAGVAVFFFRVDLKNLVCFGRHRLRRR